MKPDFYWRLRAACCEQTGLHPQDFDAHVDAVAAVVAEAKKRGPLVGYVADDSEPKEAA